MEGGDLWLTQEQSEPAAEGAFVELYASGDKLAAGLTAAQHKLHTWGRYVKRMGHEIALAGASGLAAGLAGVREFANTGNQLYQMSQQTLMSVEAIQELAFAVESVGGNLGTVQTAFAGMNHLLLEAHDMGAGAADTLRQLGLSFQQLQGMNAEDRFLALADAVRQLPSPSRQAEMAMKAFGSAGEQMLPLLRQGADGLARLREQFRAGGGGISTEDAKSAAELAKQWNLLKAQALGLLAALGTALAPAIQDVVTWLRAAIVPVKEWLSQNAGLVGSLFTVAAAVVGLGVGLAILGHALTLVSFVVGALKVVVLLASFALHGFGLIQLIVAAAMGIYSVACFLASTATTAYTVVAAICEAALSAGLIPTLGLVAIAFLAIPIIIGAVGAAFMYLTGQLATLASSFGSVMGEIGAVFSQTFGGIVDALQAGNLELAGEIAWTGLKIAFLTGLYEIEYAWKYVWASLLNVWDDFTTNIAVGMVRLWATIERGWENGTFAVQNAWATFLRWIIDRIRNTVGDVVYAAVRIARALNPTTTEAQDIAAANAARDRVLSQLGSGPSGPSEAAHNTALQRINQHEADMTQDIERDNARQQAARAAELAQFWADAMGEINALKGEMAQQLAQAASGAAWANMLRSKRGAAATAGMQAGVDSFAGGRARESSIGTFSAAQAGALAGAGSPMERIATNTQRANEILAAIRGGVLGGIGVIQ